MAKREIKVKHTVQSSDSWAKHKRPYGKRELNKKLRKFLKKEVKKNEEDKVE